MKLSDILLNLNSPSFSREQQDCFLYFFENLKKKHSLITVIAGSGGSGKTYLLGKIIDSYGEEYETEKTIHIKNGTSFTVPKNMLALCPTGIATQNFKSISGFLNDRNCRTIHSFFRVYINFNTNELNVDGILKDPYLLKEIKVIFIDEISMVHPKLLKGLIEVATKLRKLIYISGDFYQLPPINKVIKNYGKDNKEIEEEEEEGDDYDFNTDFSGNLLETTADILKSCQKNIGIGLKTFKLTKNFRSSSEEFNTILEEYRQFNFEPLKIESKFIKIGALEYVEHPLNIYYRNQKCRAFNREIHARFNDDFIHTIKNLKIECGVKLDKKMSETIQIAKRIFANNEDVNLKKHDIDVEFFTLIAKSLKKELKKYGLTASKNPYKLGIGERCMVRKNIYNEHGLMYANGTVVSYEHGLEKCIRSVEEIIFKFDGIVFKINFECNPIIPAHAFTSHKTQGLGFSQDFLIDVDDLITSPIAFPIMYVALSRRKGDSIVYLTRAITEEDISRLKKYRPTIEYILKTLF